MINSKLSLSKIIGICDHNAAIRALYNEPSQLPQKKSRNRRLLIAYREIKRSGIKVSWFTHGSFSIEKIEYGRPSIRISIDAVLTPGSHYPIEYFTIHQSFSPIHFKFPCCNTAELLQKLVRYKLLQLSETLPAFQILSSVN